MKPISIFLVLVVAMLETGCASYQSQPLSLMPSWPTEISRLEIDSSKIPLSALPSHKFDPNDGLDMTEVAMIAVANNPALMLARDDTGIAGAQAFSAGLLPDPQFGFSPQFPQNAIAGQNVTAFDLGLTYDFGAIMTHSLRNAEARSDRRNADLALLWQEWQVVGQSRLLFSRICSRKNLLSILKENRDLAELRYARDKAALAREDLPLTAAAVDENTLQTIDKQINETMRLLEKDRFALNDLLGLAPSTQLNLVGDADFSDLNKQEIAHRLSNLAKIRPDLMALQAGYEAQDMRLRQAILSQFPAINAGFVIARDNTGINYQGFSLSLSLPIFNRNQGNIAVAQATRKRMHDEFQIRLNQAYSDVEQILPDQDLLQAQLVQLNNELVTLALISGRSEAAYNVGDMDLSGYSILKDVEISKKVERNAVEESILEERIALATLLGGQLPVRESE
ncbi:MAG: TolC family protein [Ferrovum sp.]|nr:TolC family protein [Ferrovum sp.]NDU86799.1 TolC family protein [Ferrovum sp.]